MNWINIHTETLRAPEFIGAEPIERATWLCLLGYCVAQENGGLITGCNEWKDRQWQQLCGVTLAEVKTPSRLYNFTGKNASNLTVNFYPAEQEANCHASRVNGKKGGRPPKKAKSQPVDNKREKPSHNLGVNPDHNLDITLKESKGKESKVKKSNNKVAALPFLSDEFSHAWNEWQTYLKQKRKTPTELTTKKQINQLKKLNEKDAIETINRSIQNGWQGLFPSDGKDSKLTGRANRGSSRGDSSAGEGISVPLL
jgi:hypothetical protein